MDPAPVVRLVVRGFVRGNLLFQERVEADSFDIESLVPSIARRHVEILAGHPEHMIEIEWLDEINQDERFTRFGTDPSGMVIPVRLAF